MDLQCKDFKMKEKWNFNLEFIQDKDCSKFGRSQIMRSRDLV